MFNGKKIREKREALSLSAEALGKILRVKPENIYKWEKGHKPSDPEDFIKIQNWLNDSVKTNGSDSDYQKKYIALLEETNELLKATIKKLIK